MRQNAGSNVTEQDMYLSPTGTSTWLRTLVFPYDAYYHTRT